MEPTLSDLEKLARGAGAILRAGYEREHKVRLKGPIDLVTEVDDESEAFLLTEIRTRFPGSQIMAEESGVTPGRTDAAWYVDPLDGTVNYAHRIPLFCVSIAYARGGEVVLGAVYDPMREEMFSAERGAGARLNGAVIQVSEAKELSASLLVTGFPYDAWNSRRDNFDYFVKFSKMSRGVRRLGSAALDCCYVAAGRFDAFWELALNPWDVAAGGLIATEAGALVTNIDGEQDYISPPQSILAAAPGIYRQMLEGLR
jgi:myo-inositol-1(or 4)-monophosphatase